MIGLKGIDAFNHYNGRLRISVTTNCQLNCIFCHREGINNHWQDINISMDFFTKIISSFKELGGKEINLTGGEPLLHPQIQELIEVAYNPDWKLALCTNGQYLDKIFNKINKINQIKLSVHTIDNDMGRKIIGENWDFCEIQNNILEAIKLGGNITINHTYTKQNSSCFEELVEKVFKWGTNFLVCDLMETQWSNNKKIGYIDTDLTESVLLKYSTFHRSIEDNTGCLLKEYITKNNKIWRIKSSNYHKLMTEMCDNCTFRNTCGEGVFVLRVDPLGTFKPCLLRNDLNKQVLVDSISQRSTHNIMIEMFDKMFP